MYVGVGIAGRKERVAPCKGVRVVVDVLVGMWIPRTLINIRSSRLELHWPNDSARMDTRKEDAGRWLRRGDDKVRSS
jgi:hypothetical protein